MRVDSLVSASSRLTRTAGSSARRLRSPTTWTATCTIALALGLVDVACANPLVRFEQTRLAPQDGAPEGGFGRASDIDGNVAVVSATRGSTNFSGELIGAVYVYERQSNDVWMQTAKLVPTVEPETSNFGVSVAVEGNTIVVASLQGTYVFERTAGGWMQTAFLSGFYAVDIHAGVIFTSHETGGTLYQRGPSGWTQIVRVSNGFPMADTDYPGPALAISGTTAVHGSHGIDDNTPGTPSGEAFIYTIGADGSWASPSVTSVTRPNGGPGADGFSRRVVISDGVAVIGGNDAFIFERSSQGSWDPVATVPDESGHAVEDGTVLAGTEDGSVYIYRRAEDGSWDHAGTLTASTGEGTGRPQLSGTDAIAGPFVFEVPADLPQLELVQDDFQDNNADGWMPLESSRFSVVSVAGTRVLRQSDITGNARAVFTAAELENQSIQADVTPRAFATGGSERWFGLMVRYVDSQNLYYITVRNSNVVQLKRIRNGSFQTLASAPLPVLLNRPYALRLEAIDKLLRVYVNSRLLIEASDDAFTHGVAGLAMFKTRADFDNVIISPNPRRTLLDEDFNASSIRQWEMTGTRSWIHDSQRDIFVQPSTAGAERAFRGWLEGDQMVEARARATAFAGGGQRWFGLMARYIDDDNYYYVTVRNNNVISLRKLSGGAITVLDSAALAVTTGTWYTLRLEAIDGTLRVYVNNRLRLEATDTSSPHLAGRYGAVTFRTAAEYDDFLVTQP